MKHSIVLKFIAVVLCAASLLGIVVSAGGIIALTGMDLFHKTVDEVIDEELQRDGWNYVNAMALRYASKELGGCPNDMAWARFGRYDPQSQYLEYNYDMNHVGWALMDAEGNVVYSQNADLKDGAMVYTFSPEGQYMHFISAEPVNPQENTFEGVTENVDYIPEQGVEVYHLSVSYRDQSSESIGSGGPIGFLYREDDGTVAFWSSIGSVVSDLGDVTGVEFLDAMGRVVYANEAGGEAVGYFYIDENGRDAFHSYPAASADFHAFYDAVFYGEGDEVLEHLIQEDGCAIGAIIGREDGDEEILFYDPSPVLSEGVPARRMVLSDINGQPVYVLSVPNLVENVGIMRIEDGVLTYYDAAPAAAEAPTEALVPVDEASETAASEDAADTASYEEPPAAEEAPEEIPEEAPEEIPEETPEDWSEETEPEENSPAEEETPEESEAEPPAPTTEASITPPTTEAPTEPPTTEAPTEATAAAYVPEITEPVFINGVPLDEYGLEHISYYDSEAQEDLSASYVYVALPEYTVELYMAPGALRYEAGYSLLRILRNHRNDLFLALAVSALLCAVFFVYLCCAAGHRPKTAEIRAGGLNRVPLDVYLAAAVGGTCLAAVLIFEGLTEQMMERSLQTGLGLAVALTYCASLLIVGFFFALAAQVKMPKGFWWRNSLCGRVLAGIKLLALWLYHKAFPWAWGLVRKIFGFCFGLVKRFFRACVKTIDHYLRLLPLMWQWVVAGLADMMLMLLALAFGSKLLLGLWIVGTPILVLYAAKCFGVLAAGAKRMSQGDLDTKVEDKHLLGCFRDFAGDLNDLADVAVVAAQKQLKSERMKTELITNVSHDIKTPLTSIINYVDLLQKPHTEEEQEAYLEVLSRQSQRLKKLIEDLMDMSKASTGNMSVDILRLDAVEAVNQALGEFADKLDRAQLQPVFRHTEDSVPMMADGRLLWRVLSNLLGNAVKYAMPGTRVYIDLMSVEGKVVISLKNISRDELNVDADELMERFVRGDDSRNTEGSGLGLNIAKSLMELQKGQLQLLVDGDLFKVTLIFPGAE